MCLKKGMRLFIDIKITYSIPDLQCNKSGKTIINCSSDAEVKKT